MTYRTLIAVALTVAFLAAPVRADFKLTERADAIYLTDGTVVHGTVIAEGIRAVIVLVRVKKDKAAKKTDEGPKKVDEKKDDGEAAKVEAADAEAAEGEEEKDPVVSRVIKRSDILRIERGEDVTPMIEGFTSDPVNGLEVTTGRGYREKEAAPEAEDGEPAARQRQRKGAKPPKSVDELTVENLKTIARMNPQAKQAIDDLGGPAKVLKLIKSDPQLSQRVNQMLQGGRPGRSKPGNDDKPRRQKPRDGN